MASLEPVDAVFSNTLLCFMETEKLHSSTELLSKPGGSSRPAGHVMVGVDGDDLWSILESRSNTALTH